MSALAVEQRWIRTTAAGLNRAAMVVPEALHVHNVAMAWRRAKRWREYGGAPSKTTATMNQRREPLLLGGAVAA